LGCQFQGVTFPPLLSSQIRGNTMLVVLLLCALIGALAMPYRAPLQGIVGGKRTLVLLDDLVRIHNYLNHAQQLLIDPLIIDCNRRKLQNSRFS
jgi:hypothetical protein